MTDYLLFVLLASFWGGSFVAIKFIVRDFPPVFGAMLRVGTALAVLAVPFRYSGKSLRTPSSLRWKMWLAGIFAQGLPFCLLFWGEKSIAPGLAGIINGTVPLWVFLMGAALGTESFSPRKLGGLLLGFLGVFIIFRPLLAFGGTRAEALGTASVFLMALSYAVGSLLSRSLLSGAAKVDFRANLYHQHCASLAFLIVVSAVLEPWPLRALISTPAALASVLYLGVFSTAIAFLIFYHLLREWGAVRATAVTYVAPVIALFWDFVFFRNVPPASELWGVAAILSGVVLIQLAGKGRSVAR